MNIEDEKYSTKPASFLVRYVVVEASYLYSNANGIFLNMSP